MNSITLSIKMKAVRRRISYDLNIVAYLYTEILQHGCKKVLRF